jgi:hypothetical protein
MRKIKAVSKIVWFETQRGAMDSIHITGENPKFKIE